MTFRPRWSALIVAGALTAGALWLRWPGLGFSLWNVDEAIHAAAARVILDGGVLYRDAIDQRTPLSYYFFAAVFAVAGENNLWAVRLGIALLVAATGTLLYVAGARLRGRLAGAAGGALYVLLATTALHPGDANAANTEWFLAAFTAAAAAVFLTGNAWPGPGRLATVGALLGAAFLSKQPALLDIAAPFAALAYRAWRQRLAAGALARSSLALAAGWSAPVLATVACFGVRGALADAWFYTWTYNLAYYGPETAFADRAAAAAIPFQLVGQALPALPAVWLAGAVVVVHRLAQRAPLAREGESNPGFLYVAVWSLTALAGAAAGGRDFHHYVIQFLPPFCLGAGMAVGRLAAAVRAGARWSRPGSALLLALIAWPAITGALPARKRTLPEDPSRRVAAYIRAQSTPADRIFVWGFHPDIHLQSDRRPASRFLYASFLSGLVPWTNTAPERDTAYAIVPGTRETLMEELTAQPPLFIVDCSAGPNRHWQKYPLETFPALAAFVRERYELTEGPQFVPQGFRLFRRREAGRDRTDAEPAALPASTLREFSIGTLSRPIPPETGSAPFGAAFGVVDGRAEYFAHAPSRLVYRVDGTVRALRGGYGIRPGAYAAGNPGPTDGATFQVRWVPEGGAPILLLNRTLQPAARDDDRGVQSLRFELPPHAGGTLELLIGPGPAGNPASDWTFWSDLAFERKH